MKIKEERVFKMPQIMFSTIWANFMFMLILATLFINGLLYLVSYPFIPLIPLGLIIFGVVVFYLMMMAGPGEAFTKNAPDKNFQDFRRSIIYSVLTLVVFVGIYQINKPLPKKPIQLVKEQSIEITKLDIFDIHKKHIKFAISYIDTNGSKRWQSNFDSVNDRNNYLDTLVDDGKFKVKIYFKIDDHKKGSLEILKQSIKG